MPISARCDGCRRKYACPDHLAGRRVKCKHCGRLFSIPKTNAPAAGASVAEAPRKVVPKTTTEKPKSTVAVAPARPMGSLASAVVIQGVTEPVHHPPYIRRAPSTMRPNLWLVAIVLFVLAMFGGAVWLNIHAGGGVDNLSQLWSSPEKKPGSSPGRGAMLRTGVNGGGGTTRAVDIGLIDPPDVWDVRTDAPPASAAMMPMCAIPLDRVGPADGVSIVTPSAPGPFAAVHVVGAKNEWRSVDLSKGTITGTILVPGQDPVDQTAMTADGQWLAFDVGGFEPVVQVWSFVTGQKISQLAQKLPSDGSTAIAFASPDRLVVKWRADNQTIHAIVADPQTGNTVRTLYDGKSTTSISDAMAVSPGGKYVALAVRDAPAGIARPTDLLVIETATGRVCGRTEFPAGFDRVKSLAFSTDGRQLVAGNETADVQLLVFDGATGAILQGYTVADAGMGLADSVRWLPGTDGWWVDQSMLFDRRHQQVLVRATDGVLLSDGRLLVCDPRSSPPVLRTVGLPADEVAARVKAMAAVPAYVRPGQTVSVKVDVDSVRMAVADDVAHDLKELLKNRLSGLGMTVADGQPAVLHLRYAERPGPTEAVLDQNFKHTGEKRPTTQVTATLEWKTESHGIVWSEPMSLTRPDLAQIGADEQRVRDETFRAARKALAGHAIPTFIPIDPAAVPPPTKLRAVDLKPA